MEHDTGPHHPERPDRIRAIYRALVETRLIDSPDPFPEFKLQLGLKPQNAPKLRQFNPEPADEKWIALCHPRAHVEHIRHVAASGGGVLDSGDTPIDANGHDMALLSLGAALRAADAVMRGEARRCFAAGRPPGHHAEPLRPMGFCLYSNVAIAARYVQRQHGAGRVAIVDFDVHHGNGTQACLEDDPSVYFVSMHQHPHTCYPGTGHAWEIGAGAGAGRTLNLPFDPGSGDDDYLRALHDRVLPALDEFRPEVLLISAGFDAHHDDPLAQINLSDDGFEQITRLLAQLADRHCGGRVISVLEGGYNLAALGRCVVRHLVGLSS